MDVQIWSKNWLLTHHIIIELKKGKESLEENIKEEKNKGNDVEDYVVSIILDNNAEVSKEETVTVKYLVSSAHWSPAYNIYYKPEDGSAQLEYYAEILQFTGFDLDNVSRAHDLVISMLTIT